MGNFCHDLQAGDDLPGNSCLDETHSVLEDRYPAWYLGYILGWIVNVIVGDRIRGNVDVSVFAMIRIDKYLHISGPEFVYSMICLFHPLAASNTARCIPISRLIFINDYSSYNK